MKNVILILIYSLFSYFSFCQTEKEKGFNFDFEKTSGKGQLPDNWMNWSGVGYSLRIDSSVKYSGNTSLLIESTKKMDNSFGGCGYPILANYQGKQIEVRAYMKLQNVANGPIGLLLRIDDENNVPVMFDNMRKKNIQGTSDWTLYSVKLPFPENAKTIYIGALLTGTGKLWVDNFQLLIDGEDISKAKLKNQRFLKADNDHEFDKSSAITTVNVPHAKIEDLVILGKVWGFLKYYHPAVANGDYNWDYELFRIMPKIIQCSNENERNKILLSWATSLGKVKKDTFNRIEDSAIRVNPDISWIADKSRLGEELVDQLIQIKNAKRDGKNFYIGLVPGIDNPQFNEKSYYYLTKPDAGYRLLSLFRYWNIIQYYFPNKKLMDENWNIELEKFIPRFIEADDELKYKLVVLSLIAHVQDTHANIWSYDTVLQKFKGQNYAPLAISFIENRAVVTGYLQNDLGVKTGLRKGDVIKNINGKSVDTLIKEMLPYIPASNYPTQLRNIAKDLLRTNDTLMKVSYSRNEISYTTRALFRE